MFQVHSCTRPQALQLTLLLAKIAGVADAMAVQLRHLALDLTAGPIELLEFVTLLPLALRL